MNIIEKLGITPGPWLENDKSCCVISKNADPEEYKPTGHGDVEYYGGVCVAESILKRNRKVIANAPEMLQSFINILQLIEGVEIGILTPEAVIGMIRAIAEARQKDATGKTWPEIKALMEEKID